MFVLAPLSRRPILIVWAGVFVSRLGDEVFRLAVVWIAVTLVGAEAGYLASAEALAALTAGLLAGALVDRWDCRRALVVSEGLRAAAMVSLPLAALAGALAMPQLYAIALVAGVLRSVFNPALQIAILGLAAEPALLHATNGLIDGTRRVARILGPGLVGGLAATLSTESLLIGAAVTCLASMATFLALGGALGSRRRTASAPGWRAVVVELGHGARAVAGHRLMRWGLVGHLVSNATWQLGFVIGLAVVVHERFPGEIGVYGLLVAAYGVSNVAASLIVSSLPPRRLDRTMFVGRIVYGLGFLGIAAAPDLGWMVAAAMVSSLGGPMNDMPFLTLMHRDFKAELIGRVYGLRLTVDNAGAFVGAAVAAPAIALLGVEAAIAASGLASLAFGIVALTRRFD